MNKKTIIKFLGIGALSLFLTLISYISYSQACAGSNVTATIANVTQTSNTVEFDVYLNNTGATTLKLASFASSIIYNVGFLPAGATGSFTCIEQPSTAYFNTLNNTGPAHTPATRQIRWSNSAVPEASSFLMPANSAQKFARFRFTSTLSWTANFAGTLTWQLAVQAGYTNAAAITYCNGNPNSATLSAAVAGTMTVGPVTNITLNPAAAGPTASVLSGNSTICEGASTNLSVAITGGVSPYTVVINPGNITVNNYVSGSPIPVSPASTTTYTLTSVTDNALNVGTGNSGNPTVSVNALPVVTAGNVSACAGSPIALVGSPAGGSFSIADPYTGPSTTYTYTYTDGNGCTATSASATVTTNALPFVTAGNVSGCAGSPIALVGSPAGGTFSIANPYTGPSTTYTYTYTDGNGCTATSASATATTNALPVVTASNVSGCAGSPIALVGSPAGGTFSIANPYTGPSTTYTYTYTDGNGCTATSASATVTTNALPVVTAGNVSGCAGSPIALVGSPAGGTFSIANPYTGPSSTYTYTYTDGNGCTATSATANVTTNAIPVVSASASVNPVCTGGSTVLTGSGAASYAWTGGITNGVAFAPAATTTYTVTGTSAGCSSTSSITVIVTPCAGCALPTGLAVTTTSQTASISWTSNAIWYAVRYKIGAGPWTNTTSGTTSKFLNGLLPSTTYDYEVQGYCANNVVTGWAAGTFTTTTACGQPTLNAPVTTGATASLSWTANAVWYNIRYKVGASPWTNTTSNTTSKLVTGLVAGTTYDYEVKSNCAGGASVWATGTFTTAAGCTSPVLLAPVTNVNNATISWTANAVWYAIRYKVGAGPWTNLTSNTTSKLLNGLVPGTTYDYEVNAYCAGNTPSGFVGGTFTTGVGKGNVEAFASLTNFQGEIATKGNILNWSSMNEINSKAFNLYHSNDGNTYSQLATVKTLAADGNSNAMLNYSFTHTNATFGHNYYRLEFVSINDNVSSYNRIVDLNNQAGITNISIYPNPAVDLLNIEFNADKAQTSIVKIIDMTGRVIKTIQANTQTGNNTLQVSLQDLSSGMYTVQLYVADKMTHVERIQKQD